MKIQKKFLIGIVSSLCMVILILDAKTALLGAQEGIEICLQTVIPALFPFFFISAIISRTLLGSTGRMLRPLGHLCGIPAGAEPLMLLGLTGGYPIGAQAVSDAYQAGSVSKQDAQRMLGFCNNAGPAFIFGMAGQVFDNMWASWAMWAVVILSSMLTGMLLPGKSIYSCRIPQKTKQKPLEQAIKAIAIVCGWVIVFRIILYFFDRWFLWTMSGQIKVLVTGLLEITNGSIEMMQLSNPAFQFTALSVLMTFGGVCVAMQTVSVSGALTCKTYFIGKLLQTCIAVIISIIFSIFLFPGNG